MPATHRPARTQARFLAAFGVRPVTRADALGAGFTRGQLRAAIERGLLRSPRHGVLVAVGPASPGSAPHADAVRREEHLALVRASLRTAATGTLVSHDSAAVLLGLARPSASAPPYVTLTRPGAADTRTPGLRLHGSGVPLDQRTTIEDLPTTDVRRTAVDLARGRRLPSALIPLDSAARLLIGGSSGARGSQLRRLTHDAELRAAARQELALVLASCFGWPGTVAVRQALDHVDPRAESPLESRSRGWFLESGIHDLELAVPIRCGSTTYWADFCHRERRVIGEADGWGKYGQEAAEVRAAVEAERRRQRDLEDLGWTVVRWLSSESRAAVVTRMNRTLGRM